MKTPYDLDRVKLLHEAPALIALAIKRGWMSYPHNVKLSAIGSPIVVLDEEEPELEPPSLPEELEEEEPEPSEPSSSSPDDDASQKRDFCASA